MFNSAAHIYGSVLGLLPFLAARESSGSTQKQRFWRKVEKRGGFLGCLRSAWQI
jgi:hypothetical protein